MYALALAAPAYAPAAKRAPITDYRPLTTESIAEACEWESSQTRPDYRPPTTDYLSPIEKSYKNSLDKHDEWK